MRKIGLILAGGSGERFWPLSTHRRPKQLLNLVNPRRSMLGDAFERATRVISQGNVYISCSSEVAHLISAEAPQFGSRLVAEPEKRNTAGAIVWASALVSCLMGEEDLVLGVFPADHRIEDSARFDSCVKAALELAEEGKLVSIGIAPTRPETGFGYVEVGPALGRGDAHTITRFTEKPDLSTAKAFVKSGRFLWNSGMFFARLKTLESELRKASPEHAAALGVIKEAFASGQTKKAEDAFRSLPSESIDHALLERSPNGAVIRATFDWDDLGAWDSMERVLPHDENGNVHRGKTRTLESSDNVIFNVSEHQTVSLLGVDGLVVVATPDAILVCPKGRAQDVRRIAGT